MAHPVIHAEIRSADPDATRAFFGELFGWTYSDGAFPGYTFVDTGAEGAIATAIGPLQEERCGAFLLRRRRRGDARRAEGLGGTIQPAQSVPA
jgi:predicted enzyme related to lactoylglutathione lyase